MSQNKIKYVLKQGEPDSLNPQEKARKEKRAETLRAWLQKHMVPRSHIGLRSHQDGVQSLEFQKAVKEMAEKEMSAEFQKAAEEYKNIQRELGRDEMANLEEIRPMER